MVARDESPPERPRLGTHVHARKHSTDRGERVVLFDTRGARALSLDAREWSIVRAADGTRDAQGIALAASLDGVRVPESAVHAFVRELFTAGLLAPAGTLAPVLADEPHAGATDPSRAVPPERPLFLLPSYEVRCDGRGQCCRMYSTVLFAPEETARARAHCPEVYDGGRFPERVFLPMTGSTHPYASVAQRDGACAYLDARALCAIHAAGGLRAKPTGCQLFPAYFTDDGARVRVSAAPECACVLASADEGERWDEARAPAGPLVEQGAATRADLEPAALIDRVPARVRLAHGYDEVAREEAVALLDALGSRVQSESVSDVPAYLGSVASALEQGERGAAMAEGARAVAASDHAWSARWFAALASYAEKRAREDAGWRSHDDVARRAVRVVALAARACASEPARYTGRAPEPGSPYARHEAFVVRAAAHGLRYALYEEGESVAHTLRAAAVAQWVARAAPEAAEQIAREEYEGERGYGRRGEQDYALAREYPLAVVEAALRGHGLSAYARGLREGVR